ncbi:transcription-repair coupling factor [bacterium]|nr:transcription-repair coupling factor [bacterium]
MQKMYHQRNQLLGEETPVELVPPERLFLTDQQVVEALARRADVILSDFWTDEQVAGLSRGRVFNLHMGVEEFPQRKTDERLDALLALTGEGRQVLVSCDNTGQAERLADLLWARVAAKDHPPPDGRRPPAPPGVHIVVGSLDEGFHWPEVGWSVVTDRGIFGRYRQFRSSRGAGLGVPIYNLMELAAGDFVVHVDHGIARYVGLKLLEVDGSRSEFLELRFADDDVLYVPIEQVERVGRYIGSEDAPPALDRLGGRAWERTKQKAQEAILEMAQELLEIYAERAARRGHAFGRDNDWQKEFENAFVYVETPDQLKSINEVKRDLERPQPMDRLLCGDVGFGKTEVAMRAAFKVVMEGMQVAVLVPTTLLAQQHTHTFTERMADYPVTIAHLSRLASPKEQNRIIEGLADGSIDVVIGTHRLLSKDVRFSRLGLVVIDEEQRFGVRHKERLKNLRRMVDVLSLTATPIPRTLYMSLSGIRDMSMVNTPPQNRLPIETYVMDWSKPVVEGAILRELSRGGQVYFVHDRVESIAAVAHIVSEIVPDARIAVAHGQMPRNQLEHVMEEFVARKYDILVSTTIIESGLDIPNCNTMIVNRADHFGLAQLYQLRGRVGREHRQAYCYLLVPSVKALTPVARARLRTIQEYNELGSGFKIAMRDLEIRGMGNILGRHQHGHIAAIGLDLYNKLLSETIDSLKGVRDPHEDMDVVVDREEKGGLPVEYVVSGKQRLGLFKRLAALRKPEQLAELAAEMRDLYGPFPPEVERLLESARLRLLARAAGIEQVLLLDRQKLALLRLGPPRLENFDPLEYIELDGRLPGQLALEQKKGSLVLRYKPKAALAAETEELLRRLDMKRG